jgi:DNA topoisomerase-3
VYAKDKKEDSENKEKDEEQTIPEFKIGEKGEHKPIIHQGKTSPPKHYTEATLLRAMETAGKQVDDDELREIMKNNGIGRPSTRANIIETLFRRKYIERKKKNLIPTSTGMDLIDVIQDELLKSPELTGEWEFKLRKIESGEYDASQFKEELIEMVTQLTKNVINEKGKVISLQEDILPEKPENKTPRIKTAIIWEEENCPKCKENKLIKGKTAIGCTNFKNCGFKIPIEIFGKNITEKQIFDIIKKGKTSKLKGFKENEDKISEGVLILNDGFTVELI